MGDEEQEQAIGILLLIVNQEVAAEKIAGTGSALSGRYQLLVLFRKQQKHSQSRISHSKTFVSHSSTHRNR